MSHRLLFNAKALKEWRRLDATLQTQLKRKLRERLEQPRVESARLRGMADCYKIKLRQSGYRLVYRVVDAQVVVLVLSVGRRDRSQVYQAALDRYAKKGPPA